MLDLSELMFTVFTVQNLMAILGISSSTRKGRDSRAAPEVRRLDSNLFVEHVRERTLCLRVSLSIKRMRLGT